MRFHKITSLLLILSAFCLNLKADNLKGTWAFHPSFFDSPQQIIDGEDATFFFLQQQVFNDATADYKYNTATLFRYDKTNPSKGITALTAEYPNFPAIIRAVAYSPATGLLLASAEDGSLWTVPENGTPTLLGILNNTLRPGKNRVNSITPEPDEKNFWIAATWGYALVDISSMNIKKVVTTDFPVEWIAKVGDSLILFSGGKAYQGTPSKDIYSLSELTPLPIATESLPANLANGNTLASAELLLPLTGETFAFLGPRSDSSAGRSINTATRDGNKWRITQLYQDDLRSLTSSNTVNNIFGNNGASNKEGYYLHSQNRAIQLKKGINPDFTAADPTADYAGKVIVVKEKREDAQKESASWDFNNFWFFTPKSGFYTRTLSGDAWSAPGEAMMPDAPVPFVASYFTYHPDYGMLVSNHGFEYLFSRTGAPDVPWLVSAFKKGEWTNLTPAFFMPEEFASDENAKSVFNKKINSYPVANPDGIAFDPANPKYAYAGSTFGGWARINLENPAELPLHAGQAADPFYGQPGFIEEFESFSGWKAACDLSAPYFDADGRMWMLFYNVDKASENKIVLAYYTPEDLKAMENANTNPALFRKLHTIEVPAEFKTNFTQRMITLSNSKNRNIVAFHAGNFGSPLYLYDHNGTPEDLSDDRFVIIRNPHDAVNYAPITQAQPARIFEDPATGYIWMSTLLGTYLTDPSLAFTDPDNAVFHQRVRSEGSDKLDKVLFESMVTTDGCVDALGNLWVATNNSGIFCISADRGELLGEFNTSNSPLPSNSVYSILYNPERLSIMVSTRLGIAEFFPESLGGMPSGRVSMSPSAINPSVAGWVTFYGLPFAKSYNITDTEGNMVCTLGRLKDSILQWNILDDNGNRPESGTYELRDTYDVKYISFPLLK